MLDDNNLARFNVALSERETSLRWTKSELKAAPPAAMKAKSFWDKLLHDLGVTS